MRLTSENLAKILHALTIQYGNDLANEIFTNAVEDIINNYLKFQIIYPVENDTLKAK